MSGNMTMRFTIEREGSLPSAEEVARALGAAGARRSGNAFEVDFEPSVEDEGDAMFLMMCEIAKAYPEAVLAE